jgi:DUF4097 and DUF4098 domain-containing protein YvlB
MKSWFIFTLVIFMVLGLSGLRSVKAEELDDQIERTFTVNAGGTLTVDTDRGSIEVTTNMGNEVKVRVIKERGNASGFDVDMTQTGSDVEIIGDLKGNWLDWGSNRLRVKFIISVPEKYNVDLNTSGGSISVSDLEGKVMLKTSGGSLDVGRVSGPVYGRTSGGSIHLDGSKADVDIKTSGGSISIGEVNGVVDAHTSGGSINIKKATGQIKAYTSGGGIVVEEVQASIDAKTSGGSVRVYLSRQPENDCRLKTSGGSINLSMGSDIGIDIDAKTSSGKVKSDFSISGEVNKRSVRGKINGGGPELYLRTSGGDIVISKK